ncbi:MAG TPA: cytochrome b/b6 domain-containing protein [Burkholderiales bacterium]|jgi:cytochrome b
MNREKILVWDLPTRLFHWLLAGTFAGAWLTADSERWIGVHATLGYTFAGLIAFRLVWGMVGTRYARFSSFVRGPGAVLGYLKSLLTFRPQHHVGHNPAGGWAVLALLGLGIVTAAAGFLTYNDYGGHWLEELHEGAASAMLGLVVFHIAAVVVSSLLHKENLVRAMITGLKRGAPSQAIRRPQWIAAGMLLLAVAGFWSGVFQ